MKTIINGSYLGPIGSASLLQGLVSEGAHSEGGQYYECSNEMNSLSR